MHQMFKSGDPRAEAFASLFPPQDRHIYWPVRNNRELKDQLVTVMRPMRRSRLLASYLDGERLVGQPFGSTTWYGIIDLDAHSPYHTVEHLNAVLDSLERAGLTGRPVQSGLSGGWWVLVAFKQPVKSLDLGDMLEACCLRVGLEIGKGACEVYPHRDVPHQSVRLPGQLGFGPLDCWSGVPVWTVEPGDDRGVRYVENTHATTPNQKLDLRRKPRVRKPKHHVKPLLRGTGGHAERIATGEHYYRVGLVPGVSRHEATMAVQAYLYATMGGDSGRDAQLKALNRWIASKHNGLSEDWLKRPKAVLQEHERMVNWRRRGVTPKKAETNSHWAEISRRKSEATVQTLRLASALFKAAGVEPTYRLMQLVTGCSPTTVSKHKEAWKEPSTRIHEKELTRIMTESGLTTLHNAHPGEVPDEATLGQLVDKFRPVVLHAVPGEVEWVGNVNQKTGECSDVIPILHTIDPQKVGDILVRDIARDMRKAIEHPDFFTDRPVPDDAAPDPEADTFTKVKAMRARMVTKVLVGRPLDKEHRAQLLVLLVRTLRANYPTLATRIELKHWRVSFLGHTLLKGTVDFDPPAMFNTVDELRDFLGKTYVKMEMNLLRRRPDLSGPARFQVA